ncbi:MAG: SurA N-terminal domain-containing protein [Parvularculaceae bacterium]|nr:SurA N-terminal domain-containing protein [Parvularculaceae bacterium]
MLQQIRGTMKNVFAFFVIVLLILAFAAWGVPEIRQFTQNDAVRVGSEGISALEVQKEFDRFVTNRRLSNEGEFDREAAIAAGVPDQIVKSLAVQSALRQEARRLGLVMARERVREFLQTNEQFKNPRTGKFDNEALTGIMREYNYTVREFEDRLQSDLLRNQLMSAVSVGGPAPKAVVDALVLRETEKRTISYLTITDDMAGAPAAATPEALKGYYETNSAQFMAPEYRRFTAVVLKSDDFVDRTKTSEEELRKAYEAKKSAYETPERRTIYQITYDDEAKAKAAADAVRGGRPFETLAVENGQTLADVTFTDVTKRDLVDPKVADAAFGAGETGAVVGPVKGVFGWTIAQIAAITPASTKPFEDVRAEIEEELLEADTKKKLFEAVEAIEAERDTGAALADAAKKSGAKAVEFGPVDSYSFGTGGEIVADLSPEILKEAFKLEEGAESEAIEFDDKSGYYFVAVAEVVPSAAIPYEKVAAEVETKWRASERGARIAAVVKSLRDAVAKGKTLKEAAAAFNRAPIVETVTRRSPGQNLTEPLIEQIFSAAKGETISGPSAMGDAELVIAIDDIAFDVAKVSPDDVSVFAQYIGGQISEELSQAYASAVEADFGVKISQSQIDGLFSDGQ